MRDYPDEVDEDSTHTLYLGYAALDEMPRDDIAPSIRGAVDAFLALRHTWQRLEGPGPPARDARACAFLEHARAFSELGTELSDLAIDAFA